MTPTLRIAQQKDVPAILEIVNYEIKNSTVVYDYTQRTLEQQLAWFHLKMADEMPVIVAEFDGIVVGFGSYGIFRPWEAYKYCVEHSIYVHKDSRGLGIGKMLLAELIKIARKNGLHSMIAGVDASNGSSIEFHKKFGFEIVGEFKEVGFKFDQWLDLTFMQLMLNKQ